MLNIVRAMRHIVRELRDLDWPAPRATIEDMRARLEDALLEPGGAVHLGFCVGLECNRLHGIRVATWRGFGPSSIYIVCDECHAERLTGEEREHMEEVFGAECVRHLGLHELHNGRFPEREP